MIACQLINIEVIPQITIGDIITILIAIVSALIYLIGRTITLSTKAYYNYSTIVVDDSLVFFKDQLNEIQLNETDEIAYQEILDEAKIIQIDKIHSSIVSLSFSEPIKCIKLFNKDISSPRKHKIHSHGTVYAGQVLKYALYINEPYSGCFFRYRRIDGSLGIISIEENLKDGGYCIEDKYRITFASLLYYCFSK